MKHPFFTILFILGAICSCRKEITLQLKKADTLINDYPDSALAILKTIPSNHIRRSKEEARYALLMSVALDKNYIDIQSDSLIKTAVDYYSSKGNTREKMLSWYYNGIVLKNSKEFIPSILSFENAEKEATVLKDCIYLGLIFKNKASIYSMTNNNPAAVECRQKAVDFFEKAGAQLYRDYAELALANDLSNQKENAKADSLLNDLLSRSKDSLLIWQSYVRKASLLVKEELHPETAIELYRRSPSYLYGILDYLYLAEAFEMVSVHDSADYWITKGYDHCLDEADSASLDYLRSRIELSREHYIKAFHLVDHAVSVQDSLTRVLLQQSVSTAQRDYYKSEALLQEEQLRSLRQKSIFGTILSLLSISVLSMAAMIRSRKKDRLLQEQMARLALEEKELERVNRDNAHLVGSLFSEKIDHLDRLSESYFKMEEGKQKDLAFRQIKQLVSTIRNDEGLFLSLEKDLDRYRDGIMSKLRTQVPRIKGENLKTITLFFAGFPYETVQLILNKVSIESLRMVRSRCRKEILAAEAPDAELFLKMLEIEKRPQAGTNERS